MFWQNTFTNYRKENQPFVHIDLGSLSENLLNLELFGYKKVRLRMRIRIMPEN